MAKYSGRWIVSRVNLDTGPESQGDVLPTFHRHSHRRDYIGMVYPVTLYPTKEDLPTRRTEIDLFPELRHNDLQR